MTTDKQLTVEQFVMQAIEKLASPGRETIHTVYTGFNAGFRTYFPDKDPVKEVKLLVEAGVICSRFCRGGALIGKPGSIKPTDTAANALKKMGIQS